MNISKIESTLKNAKPNNLFTFQINKFVINIAKHNHNLNGGLFELNINDEFWNNSVGYLTINEVLSVIKDYEKINT
jgi:hypothetical protein